MRDYFDRNGVKIKEGDICIGVNGGINKVFKGYHNNGDVELGFVPDTYNFKPLYEFDLSQWEVI